MHATSNSLLSTTGVQVPPQQRQLLSEMRNCISENLRPKITSRLCAPLVIRCFTYMTCICFCYTTRGSHWSNFTVPFSLKTHYQQAFLQDGVYYTYLAIVAGVPYGGGGGHQQQLVKHWTRNIIINRLLKKETSIKLTLQSLRYISYAIGSSQKPLSDQWMQLPANEWYWPKPANNISCSGDTSSDSKEPTRQGHCQYRLGLLSCG